MKPLEDVVAYMHMASDGSVRLLSRDAGEALGREGLVPVTFASELGRSVFYNWVCRVLELAVKRARRGYLLGGCTWFYDELRLDVFTFGEPLNDDVVKTIVDEALAMLKGETVRVKRLTKADARRALMEGGEVLLYEALTSLERDEVTVAVDDKGNMALCLSECVEQRYDAPILEVVNQSEVHWKGDERLFKLRRVHLRAYPSPEAKRVQLELEKELALRDHVQLGKELDLFVVDSRVGAGLVLWAPRGALIRRLMEDFEFRAHLLHGYQPVVTPHIALGELFEVSGHLRYYRENMYVFEHDGKTHAIKPMNCPFHILLFKRRRWSYRDLPVRYFEFGTVYRYERAGTLHGLTRVRGLTQDDAHIFLRPDQIHDEVRRVLDFLKLVYESYGISRYSFTLSLRDPANEEKYVGSPELWDRAEKALEDALSSYGVPYRKAVGEAAFYGPKIDVYLRDSLGRDWQCGTVQLDFNLPERFDLRYVDQDNTEKRVVMIHRAIVGSFERFLGVLLEYYAGRLPLWLSPVQVAVLPVDEESEEQRSYVLSGVEEMVRRGVRAEAMLEGRLSARVREARRLRVPLLVVVGPREISEGRFEAVYIRYGTDERGRYRPVEERMSFSGFEELAEWVRNEVRRETHGVLQ